MSEIDHILTDDIICPYCGEKGDTVYYSERIHADSRIEVCEHCGEKFEFYADTKIVWVTSRIK